MGDNLINIVILISFFIVEYILIIVFLENLFIFNFLERIYN